MRNLSRTHIVAVFLDLFADLALLILFQLGHKFSGLILVRNLGGDGYDLLAAIYLVFTDLPQLSGLLLVYVGDFHLADPVDRVVHVAVGKGRDHLIGGLPLVDLIVLDLAHQVRQVLSLPVLVVIDLVSLQFCRELNPSFSSSS